MAKMGRPRIEIDKKIFENLCAIQCTEVEICDCFECCEDTLNSWCKRTYKKTFSEIYAQKRGRGRSSLRRMQWKAAEKGNATMLVWLGKQYLDQKNKIEDTANISMEILSNIKSIDEIAMNPADNRDITDFED